MRKALAISVARLARYSSRKTKSGGGTTLPGLLAEKIDPNIVTKLAKKIPNGIIIVTGTNGKTTTAKMLSAILTEAGHKVICNFGGSNLSRGVASILIEHSNSTGTKIDGDIAVFEVDEATMPEIVNKIPPQYILVTNLFRDQLDRYGEIDKTAEIIGSALSRAPQATVFLNADDPLVASLNKYNNNAFYFGLKSSYVTKSMGAIDSKTCLSCGSELVYERRYFGHLGEYRCPKCSFSRPALHYLMEVISLSVDKSTARFSAGDKQTDITIQIPGIYNLYNALAAATVAGKIGIEPEKIAQALGKVSAAFGRMEKIKIVNKNVAILLVKNPTGFNQSLETLVFEKNKKNLLLLLNDQFADGTDISWIWDAELEIIKDLADKIVVSGIRAEDMFLRLKYGLFDLANVAIEKDLGKALDTALAETKAGDTLYVLPTYTAMLDFRKLLKSRGFIEGLLE